MKNLLYKALPVIVPIVAVAYMAWMVMASSGTGGVLPFSSTGTGSVISYVSYASNPQTFTLATTGTGDPQTLSFIPITSAVRITCNDTDSCDITLTEAGATEGQWACIYNDSSNSVDLLDIDGQAEWASDTALSLGLNDVACTIYQKDRWVQISHGNI